MNIDWETPLTERDTESLCEEVGYWRQQFANLPDAVRYYMSHVGCPVRIVTRNYRGYLGVFQGAYFQANEVEIGVEAVEFDTGDGQKYHEVKVMRLPMSNVVQMEFLAERDLVVADAEPDGDNPAGEVADLLNSPPV